MQILNVSLKMAKAQNSKGDRHEVLTLIYAITMKE